MLDKTDFLFVFDSSRGDSIVADRQRVTYNLDEKTTIGGNRR